MPKIGIDVRLWNETGVGRYIRNLVAKLGELDRENQYVLFGLSRDLESIKYQVGSSKYGKNFIIIPADIRWHSVREQFEFPRLLNRYQLDLVHFPYFSVPVFYKRPYVVTVHDLIINNFPTGRASTLPFPFYDLKRLGYQFVLRKAIHDAKKIIVPSDATKNEIIKIYKHGVKSSNIFVTPEGVDESFSDFSPTIFRSNQPYFLYVGNAYPHKNLERLLEAFKVFSIKYSVLSMKLVGKEDYFYKKLRGYVKKNKIENVEFLGYVSDEELAKLYKNASATFIPSVMEGFGLTALEVMKMGSIVACSRIPSLEEVCGKGAIYFNPMDTLSIVGAMKEVEGIGEEKRDKMKSEGKKNAEKYSWEKTAKLTLEVYNSILITR